LHRLRSRISGTGHWVCRPSRDFPGPAGITGWPRRDSNSRRQPASVLDLGAGNQNCSPGPFPPLLDRSIVRSKRQGVLALGTHDAISPELKQGLIPARGQPSKLFDWPCDQVAGCAQYQPLEVSHEPSRSVGLARWPGWNGSS
jgi:hypothetical protein